MVLLQFGIDELLLMNYFQNKPILGTDFDKIQKKSC